MGRGKEKKLRPVHVELIRDDEAMKGAPYEILAELIDAHHKHLRDAKIALAWHNGWPADPEGHLRLGQTKKASDLDHVLHGYDWVILLNRAVWNQVDFSKEQMAALLDHELCHCAEALDDEGDERIDENNRKVWRVRKHDIEEFAEIMERHGCWQPQLIGFVRRALRRQPSLFAAEEIRST